MSKKDRLFLMIWGLVVFPLLIVFVTVQFHLGSSVIIALLTYMGLIKYILAKDSADSGAT